MELMIEKLLGFVLILTRISAFFLVIPVFSWKTIPVRIKVALVLLMTIFFFNDISFWCLSQRGFNIRVHAVDSESFYGFALGLIVVLIFSAVKLSGRIIERKMGLALAQTLDPLTDERGQPMGMLLEIIFILLFLSANGHHLFLLIISRSYETFPAGSIPTIPVLVSGVIKAGSTMFVAGLRLAAPMMAAFLLLLMILAVFARIMPDMNILFISMPLRVGLGLLMTGMFLPFINGFTSEFAEWMGKLLPL